MNFDYLYQSVDFDHDILEILNDQQKTEEFRSFLISGDINIFSLPWKKQLTSSFFNGDLISIVMNFPYPDDFLNFVSIFNIDTDLIIPLYESHYSQNKQIFFKPFVKPHYYLNNELFRPLWHGIITKDISEKILERNHPRLRLFLKKYNPEKLKLDQALINLTDKDLIYTLIDFYGIGINYFKLNDDIINHMLNHHDQSVYILMKLIDNNIEFNDNQLQMIKSNPLMYETYALKTKTLINHQPDDLNYRMVDLLKSQNYHFNHDDLTHIINSGVFDNHEGFIISDQAEELIDVLRGKNKVSKLFKTISRKINVEHINNFLFHNNVKPEIADVFLLGNTFISTLIKEEHHLLDDIIPLIITDNINYNNDYFYPVSVFKSQISVIKNNFSENILPFILKHNLIGPQYTDLIKDINLEIGIWYENILNIAENMNMENQDIRALISAYIENNKPLNEIELLF